MAESLADATSAAEEVIPAAKGEEDGKDDGNSDDEVEEKSGDEAQENEADASAEAEEVECSGDGEDCRTSKCCQREGTVCYEKNEHWASCLAECTPGMILKWDEKPYDTKWNCKQL